VSHPVVAGFHPDPTICSANGEYVLACSSFEYFPGVPLFRSTDLLHWEQIGNALDRPSQFDPGGAGASRGIYAPTLRHHDGRFWLVTTNVSEAAKGHMLLTAADPAGPWSEPVFISGAVGIDPDIAWDADGACYVTWCATRPGPVGIVQARIEPETGTLLEEPRRLWSGTGLAHPEAPHVYAEGSWWYLMIAEGGTERGHCVSLARSRDITGPYAGAPGNPLLSHRSTTHPVQNTGHADLVRRPDGSWAAVYLGVRPRGFTPGFHVNGREVFLAGIDWRDGWPVFDEDRFPVVARDHSFTDDFAGELHPRWVSPNGAPQRIATRDAGPGVLLDPEPTASGEPGLLAVRARDLAWTATARVRSGDGRARLVVRLDDVHWCAVDADREAVRAHMRVGPVRAQLGTALVPPGAPVDLVISAADGGTGPDELRLGVLTADGFQELARVDGRYLSTEVAGGFTGRVIGVRAEGTPVRLERFTYRTEG
jgi:xylan 1,4-beta-xylosidase